MCLVVYVASPFPLPLVSWQQDAPAFNVTELTEYEEPVRRHFTLPHVRQAGSHTGCGCGFNEGREYPEAFAGPAAERVASMRSSLLLERYICENQVGQIFSCWSGDEDKPQEFERCIVPTELTGKAFFFRERERLEIHRQAA